MSTAAASSDSAAVTIPAGLAGVFCSSAYAVHQSGAPLPYPSAWRRRARSPRANPPACARLVALTLGASHQPKGHAIMHLEQASAGHKGPQTLAELRDIVNTRHLTQIVGTTIPRSTPSPAVTTSSVTGSPETAIGISPAYPHSAVSSRTTPRVSGRGTKPTCWSESACRGTSSPAEMATSDGWSAGQRQNQVHFALLGGVTHLMGRYGD